MWLHHKSADKKTVSDRKTGQKSKTRIRWTDESFIPVYLIWEIKTFNYFIWRSNRKSPFEMSYPGMQWGCLSTRWRQRIVSFIIDIDLVCHNFFIINSVDELFKSVNSYIIIIKNNINNSDSNQITNPALLRIIKSLLWLIKIKTCSCSSWVTRFPCMLVSLLSAKRFVI